MKNRSGRGPNRFLGKKLTCLLALLLASAGPVLAAAHPSARTDEHGRRAMVRAGTDSEAKKSLGGGAPPRWESLGPFGGEVNDIARSPVDPSVLLAATVAGTYRSEDGGASWSLVEPLGLFSAFELAVAADGTIFVGTLEGLWATEDEWSSFQQLDTGAALFTGVLAIGLDPGDADTLWVGLQDVGNGAPTVRKSTDGGETWAPAAPPVAEMSCNGIAVTPGDSNKVFAVFEGFFGGGSVWISTDGGTSWTDRTAGLPANPMRVVQTDGSRVLVGGGQLFGGQAVGLYSSINDGLTWTALHDGSWPRLVTTGVAVDPNDPQTLMVATDGGGLHRSTDGGASWDIAIGDSDGFALRSVRFDPGSSTGVAITSASLGVFLSTDSGTTFSAANTGLRLIDIQGVAANPLDPEELAVTFSGNNDGGVYRSTDGGATWALEDVPPTRWDGIGFAPDGTLYALSDGPSSVAPEALYRRESGGSWTFLGPDQGTLFESDLDVMRFSANDPGLILLGGTDFGVAGSEATVWRSANGGASWSKVFESPSPESGQVSALEIVQDGSDLVQVASVLFGNPAGDVLRSIDGGLSWVSSSTGLGGSAQPSDLCAFPGAPETFYLADRDFAGGLYVSTDAGQSWSFRGFPGAALQNLVCDSATTDTLYVTRVFSGDDVYRSTDAGSTFEPFVDGLPNVAARDLELVPGPSPRLLLASNASAWQLSFEGSIFADGFESGDPSAWSSTSP